MKKLFGLALLALAFLPGGAEAASCFWVGGTATWDATNTGGGGAGGIKWASTSGGASACAGGGTGGSPSTADTATFDASSGGGTVTVAATINGSNTVQTITAGAFTGTIDFSVNNPSITITNTLNLSGTGTRKFLLGTGTFTFTGAPATYTLATTTNLDGTSVLTAPMVFSTTGNFNSSFSGGGRTYGSLTINADTGRREVVISGANTFSNLILNAGADVQFPTNTTITVTNAFTWTGTSSNPISIRPDNSSSGSPPAISIASGTSTCTWCAIYESAVSGGGTFNATNSLDLGRNTGWTITAPSAGGGGGRIIGG